MKIGFIGLGIMGKPMALNIVKKHDDTVYVYDHHEENMAVLRDAGAVVCADECEVAQNADLIITMVPTSAASKEAWTKMLPLLHEGMSGIDMSTISPEVSLEIADMVRGAGARFIDAPVVKSKGAAEAGELGIYVGASDEDFAALKPVLSYMGTDILHLGENGSGLVMKILHNGLVAQIQNGVNETLGLARRFGIPGDVFAEAIALGGAKNAYLPFKVGVITAEDWTPAFSVKNMHKDVHLCLEMAESKGMDMPGEANAARVFDEAMERGYGPEDFSKTYKVVND